MQVSWRLQNGPENVTSLSRFTGRGKVPVASNYAKTSGVTARGDLYLSMFAIAVGIAGVISDCVLVTDLAGNLAPDSIELAESSRKICAPSAQFRNPPEHPWIPVRIAFVIDTDGIDGRPCPLGKFNHIIQAESACVVSAIADQHEDLAVAGTRVEMSDSRSQPVVERRQAVGSRSEKSGADLGQFVRELNWGL